VVRVEYQREEKTRVCYGEIDETKLANFQTGEENFIWMENDENINWVDKESLISIETLSLKTAFYVKPRITDYYRTTNNRETGICF
jgi:hypothetical protein